MYSKCRSLKDTNEVLRKLIMSLDTAGGLQVINKKHDPINELLIALTFLEGSNSVLHNCFGVRLSLTVKKYVCYCANDIFVIN